MQWILYKIYFWKFFFHMYYKLICILYALLCGQNFILVKSGCYISKALVYSKMKFYSEKNFAHFRPNRPSSQPAHPDFRPSRNPFFFLSSRSFPPPSPQGLGLSVGPAHLTAQPATFFLLPHRSQTHEAPPPAGLAPPPRSTPPPSTERKKNGRINLPSFPH
jgi:hypothetical protein